MPALVAWALQAASVDNQVSNKADLETEHWRVTPTSAPDGPASDAEVSEPGVAVGRVALAFSLPAAALFALL
jgi:hypothetical protein